MSRIQKYILFLLLPILGGIVLCLIFATNVFNTPKAEAPVLVTASSSVPEQTPAPTATSTDLGNFQYVEVTDSCSPYYVGTCVRVRSGPGTQYSEVERLRTGVVLKVSTLVTEDGHGWYKVSQDPTLRFPERVTSDWYVSAENVQLFTDPGEEDAPLGMVATTTKRIVVDISKETLYAYDGDTIFMQEPISTGLELTPTADGVFSVFKKTPSRYMQGPIPGLSDQVYDLPGVPWDLYFTADGSVIHGAYWHDHFGEPWSHGCVNLSPQNAKKLYEWADLGTPVIIMN